ncbi:MAG: hypothetical protein OEV64_09655 [Desulfobulbaceae bacterium]|nr:hypothetical protein [Desulfobulbaceae bacterium]
MNNNSKTFKPFLSVIFSLFLIFLVFTIYFVLNWESDFYIKDTSFLGLSFIGLIICGKPVLFCPHVTITNNKYIQIHYWVGTGHGDDIARSMHEIVVKGDYIRSFRFKLDNKYFQISPMGYKDGDEMQRVFIDIINKKKLKLSTITL